MEYKSLLKDFAKRTKANLDFIDQKSDSLQPRTFEITQLVNSFLGLLVLFDKQDANNIPKMLLSDVEKRGGFAIHEITKKPSKDLRDFIHHLRNAFAHVNLSYHSNMSEIESVTLQNIVPKTGILYWQCCLSVPEIRFLLNLIYEIIMGL
jgi:hypothetical protein